MCRGWRGRCGARRGSRLGVSEGKGVRGCEVGGRGGRTLPIVCDMLG